MKVFIENEAGSNIKKLFNEETFEYQKSVKVSAVYPFPYGFLLNTKSGDGDNLDCFVLTKQPLKSQEIIEIEPIGMFEEIEDDKEDHKILAVLPGETWDRDQNLEQIFRDFSAKVFSHLPHKKKVVGRFLGKEDAIRLIESAKRLSTIKIENMKTYLIKKSKIHGKGLFANKNFKQGELIFSVDISRLPRIKPNDKLSEKEEFHVDYVGRGQYVISAHAYAYINHSCNPNVLVKHETIARSKFYAMRDIKKGEQLTYDYGVNAMDQIDKELWKTKCKCGSKNCRGTLSTCFLKQPLEIQKKYYKYLPLSLKRKALD